MTPLSPSREGLAIAAACIRSGGIVAYPTETVYGLAVDPFSEEAVAALFEAKGRAPEQPVLLVIADLDQLGRVAGAVSERASAYAEAFWPGPLSLVLPRADALPKAVTAGRSDVCVRCPSSDVTRALCRAAGMPLTSTSANRSGESPARSLSEIDLPGVAFGVDGGRLEDSPPSTVLEPERGAVLREGAVSAAALEAFARRAGYLC